ncbi:FmdB family transcriptional regulator [Nocardioides marinus]|uniref:Putative FmdB family regulatory protein n=1 Tax=Nocardioides marinus TaxID=374514 RepID=A0A7Y9YAZ0_9ACTN|nr:FmdB family zinc ribbon protein [Nocardioides marinus]NYI08898.1 putative FmdB family regulatory protein [Nocardioides marinus]
MPTYQYACTECDHAFEQFQSFSDASLTECPQCQGRLRKVYNAVGVVFKGSGFYRTDSRSGASSSSTAGSSSTGSSSESSSTSSTSDSGSSASGSSSTPSTSSGSSSTAAAAS